CRALKTSWLRAMDYVCQAAPAWHVFGRMGCLAAGCCYGRPAHDLPWAIVFRDPRALLPPELLGVPLHPSQIYDGLGDLVLALLLYFFLLKPIEKGKLPRGTLCGAEFCGYAVLRFVTEPFRGDAIVTGSGLTAAQ